MFISTLTGPFYSHLLGSSSSGFTELILTGERVESGIRSGKIQVAASSSATQKPSYGKKESNAVYGQKSRDKSDRDQSVGAVMISNPAPTKQQQRGNQRQRDKPRRQFTRINMPMSQALQHLLKMNLVTLREPHPAPDTSSPNFNPNARCAFHSNSPGHDTDSCWALKHQIQDPYFCKVRWGVLPEVASEVLCVQDSGTYHR